jgi:hypothetical protein
MLEGILVPLAFFAMIAAIEVAPRYFKSQERQRLQETLRAAIEKGQPIPPEIVEAMATDVRLPPSPGRDLRKGVIWLGVAVGLVVMGLVVGLEEPDVTYPMLGVAAFPGFIGLAFIVIGLIGRSKT